MSGMTKPELIERIADKQSPLAKPEAELAVKVMLGHMTASLADGGRIEIGGFGVYSLHSRAARIGRNPRTGTLVLLHARRATYFKPARRYGSDSIRGREKRPETRAASRHRPAFDGEAP